LGVIGGDRARAILQEIASDSEFESLHEAAEEALEDVALFAGEIEFDWLDVDDDESSD